MALQTFPFNGTNGTTLTNANTGASSTTISAGCSATFATAAAYQGATGAEYTVGATGFANQQFNLSSSATQAAFSIRFKIPAAVPAATQQILQVNDTAAARIVQLQYTTAGTVKTNDKANTGITILTAAQATAGSWVRLELVITALSATAGAFTARAYSSGSTQVGTTASTTTANTGTTNINGATIGVLVSGAAYTHDLDSLQMNGGSTSEIGEYAPNSTPPTINSVSANQTVTPGATVPLTASATAAGADSIASYSWSILSAIDNTGATFAFPTISNPTSASASFVWPSGVAGGRIIVGVTATDTSGNTSAQSTTRAFVQNAAGTVIEVTSNTGWLTTTPSNVSDASDATYAESGGVGSGAQLVYRLSPLQPATSGFSLDVRSLVQATGGTQRVELLEGATVRKNWGGISPGTSMGDTILTLTTGEMATIGSWNELDLRLTQV